MAVTAMVVFGGPYISLLHKGLKDIIVVLVLPSSLFVAICVLFVVIMDRHRKMVNYCILMSVLVCVRELDESI